MFYIPIKHIFISVAVLIAFGFSIIRLTSLSTVLQNYPSISFVLGILAYAAVLLVLGKNSENDSAFEKPSNDTSNLNESFSTLYIGNIQYRINEKEVKSHFSRFGDIKSVRLMKDKKTGKRKGFGFVEVAKRDAKKVIDSLNDTEFHDRTLKVRPAKEKMTT